MAVPYFKSGSTYVYFDYGMLVPYPVSPERPQSIGKAENGKLKVYDHSLAGTYKRTWKLKAIMDESLAANHKFSDLVAFINTTIVWAKTQFSYCDKNGTVYTVRFMDWLYDIEDNSNFKVTIVIEEDYV